jgi:hypothetical protein
MISTSFNRESVFSPEKSFAFYNTIIATKATTTRNQCDKSMCKKPRASATDLPLFSEQPAVWFPNVYWNSTPPG